MRTKNLADSSCVFKALSRGSYCWVYSQC